MTDRRRNLIVLAIVGFLLVMSLLLIIPGGPFAKKTQLGLDLRGGVELIYQAEPTPQVPKVTPQAVSDAINTIRKRTNALGVSESEVQQQGRDTIVVGLPGVKNAARAEDQVGTTAQLQFYDWEPNVIGPNGKELGEHPADPQQALGVANTPLTSLLDAVKLGTKAKPLAEANDIPASGQDDTELRAAGVNPSDKKAVEQFYDKKNDTSGKKYYLFNKTDQLIAGPETTCKDLLSNYTDKAPPNPKPLAKPIESGTCATELNALGRAGPPAGSKIYVVPQGIVIIQAERPANLKNSKISGGYYVLEDDSELNGSDIKDPKQAFDPQTNEPIVTFNFSNKGRQAFARVTKRIAERGASTILIGGTNQDKFQHFAITLDDQIVSRAYIDFVQNPEGIDGRTGAQINGIGTIQETQDLAQNLRIGALPVKLKLISKTQVSASLGKQALHQGLIAGGVGLLLTVLFLLVFYRVLGVVAVLGLVTYGILLFALIKLIPITMTLPGIAGMILTLGVAADANIVIFERVKEEMRHGRSIPAAIANGYSKALKTIIDANVVTIGVAFILFMLATGGVKGFAFTLGIGTIVSLLTAVLATSAVLGTMARSRLLRSKHTLGVGEERHFWRRFDFMGNSKWFFSMSGVILVAGALAIAGIGVNFGIDFESGSRIVTPLEKAASVDQVRSVMDRFGYGDAKIQTVKDPDLGKNVIQISTKTLQPAKVDQIRQALDQRFGVRQADFTSESIGPTFGAQIARTAGIALVASLILISLYIMMRFEVKYSVPVLIALAHDILITGGVYALTQREVTTSTVAALLTILGYSLYDTIIVFDRIRENAPRMPRATFSQIVNRSMAEVLSRSLATSLCTLLPVLSLLFFGGQTLKDFAFALLVGIASGAYSSIFIASPVLTEWKEREPLYRRRRQLVMEDNGGVVPPYAVTQLGDEEETGDGTRRRTGRRVIADRPGRPARSARPPAAQRMAGPLAPEVEMPDAAVGAPHVMEPDEIDPDEIDADEIDADADAQLAEDSAEVTNGADGDDAAAARRAERRRQQRAKRKHGRR